MPLPEGISELGLGRRAGRPARADDLPRRATAHPAEADFCITGTADPGGTDARGPVRRSPGLLQPGARFPGDAGRARLSSPDAIWPFTVVGRPPQEDSIFGQLIHELAGPVIPQAGSGRAGGPRRRCGRRASAAAGHRQRALRALRPGTAGRGNCSPWPTPCWGTGNCRWPNICGSSPARTIRELDVHDVADFLRHVLERVDWRRDLHFQTCTTIDTLDYSGGRLNEGSKLVIAAAGPPRADAAVALRQPAGAARGLGSAGRGLFLPGILAWCEGPGRQGAAARRTGPGGGPVLRLRQSAATAINGFPLVVVVDRQRFCRADAGQFSLDDLHPQQSGADIYGIEAFWLGQALGLPRLAGDRRPEQAAPRPAAGRRPGGDRRVDALAARAARCTG